MLKEMDNSAEKARLQELPKFSRRELFRIGGAAAAGAVLSRVEPLLSSSKVAEAAPEADAGVPYAGGRFYTETNGGAGPTKGFSITDSDGTRFWSEFQRLGGVDALGYPASRRFKLDGFSVQVTQRVILQWRPEVGQTYFVNVFDKFSDMGLDDRLFRERQVPYPKKWDEAGKSWDAIVSNRLVVLDSYPALKAKYFDVVGDPIQANGLPTSDVVDMGNHWAVRCQRVVIQLWKEDVPWARKGQATVALGGDFAKQYGLVPAEAQVVEDINGTSTEPISAPEPTPQVQIPDLPSGGIHSYTDQGFWRNHYLSGFTQNYKETSLSAQGFGRLDSWTVAGDKIILKINISGMDREVVLTPRPGNTVRFFAGRTSEIFFYASPDVVHTRAGMDKYFKLGDPIAFFVRTDGAITKDGSGQRVTTWE